MNSTADQVDPHLDLSCAASLLFDLVLSGVVGGLLLYYAFALHFSHYNARAIATSVSPHLVKEGGDNLYKYYIHGAGSCVGLCLVTISAENLCGCLKIG